VLPKNFLCSLFRLAGVAPHFFSPGVRLFRFFCRMSPRFSKGRVLCLPSPKPFRPPLRLCSLPVAFLANFPHFFSLQVPACEFEFFSSLARMARSTRAPDFAAPEFLPPPTSGRLPPTNLSPLRTLRCIPRTLVGPLSVAAPLGPVMESFSFLFFSGSPHDDSGRVGCSLPWFPFSPVFSLAPRFSL